MSTISDNIQNVSTGRDLGTFSAPPKNHNEGLVSPYGRLLGQNKNHLHHGRPEIRQGKIRPGGEIRSLREKYQVRATELPQQIKNEVEKLEAKIILPNKEVLRHAPVITHRLRSVDKQEPVEEIMEEVMEAETNLNESEKKVSGELYREVTSMTDQIASGILEKHRDSENRTATLMIESPTPHGVNLLEKQREIMTIENTERFIELREDEKRIVLSIVRDDPKDLIAKYFENTELYDLINSDKEKVKGARKTSPWNIFCNTDSEAIMENNLGTLHDIRSSASKLIKDLLFVSLVVGVETNIDNLSKEESLNDFYLNQRNQIFKKLSSLGIKF